MSKTICRDCGNVMPISPDICPRCENVICSLPDCKSADLYRACDVEGCKHEASAGTPTIDGGYTWRCMQHPYERLPC